ncbi:hypothetical protein CPB86DRAFT_596357 [Serendipita vermifera]|nr:hypothetical protein CPB86DRAFT_596357 [Serendipita vermifera]
MSANDDFGEFEEDGGEFLDIDDSEGSDLPEWMQAGPPRDWAKLLAEASYKQTPQDKPTEEKKIIPEAPVENKKTRPPATGYRIPLEGGMPLPDISITGPPPFRDVDGSPVFLGSGIMGTTVQPCKICPARPLPCVIPYGGWEVNHPGRYDLLPFDPETMEWVPTRFGRVPAGRKAVEGGYEDHGVRLYHAVGYFEGHLIPGKTGVHLGGVRSGLNGIEHFSRDEFLILCWRESLFHKPRASQAPGAMT